MVKRTSSRYFATLSMMAVTMLSKLFELPKLSVNLEWPLLTL